MIKLKNLLTEKTFNISNDVDFIYETGGFKRFVKSFKKDKNGKNTFLYIDKILQRKNVLFNTIKSSQLKDVDSVKAHLVNPVDIACGIFLLGSYYKPIENFISISFNHSALYVFGNNEEDFLSSEQAKMIKQEITEGKIKSTISHELSHWISDSLYNNHIGRILSKAEELKNSEIIKLGKKNVDMTYFEIDAQIHGIKELKRKYESKWDTFTLNDIFQLYTALHFIAIFLYKKYGQDVLDIWQKMLLKRMFRENLLGKNMKKFVRGGDL